MNQSGSSILSKDCSPNVKRRRRGTEATSFTFQTTHSDSDFPPPVLQRVFDLKTLDLNDPELSENDKKHIVIQEMESLVGQVYDQRVIVATIQAQVRFLIDFYTEEMEKAVLAEAELRSHTETASANESILMDASLLLFPTEESRKLDPIEQSPADGGGTSDESFRKLPFPPHNSAASAVSEESSTPVRTSVLALPPSRFSESKSANISKSMMLTRQPQKRDSSASPRGSMNFPSTTETTTNAKSNGGGGGGSGGGSDPRMSASRKPTFNTTSADEMHLTVPGALQPPQSPDFRFGKRRSVNFNESAAVAGAPVVVASSSSSSSNGFPKSNSVHVSSLLSGIQSEESKSNTAMNHPSHLPRSAMLTAPVVKGHGVGGSTYATSTASLYIVEDHEKGTVRPSHSQVSVFSPSLAPKSAWIFASRRNSFNLLPVVGSDFAQKEQLGRKSSMIRVPGAESTKSLHIVDDAEKGRDQPGNTGGGIIRRITLNMVKSKEISVSHDESEPPMDPNDSYKEIIMRQSMPNARLPSAPNLLSSFEGHEKGLLPDFNFTVRKSTLRRKTKSIASRSGPDMSANASDADESLISLQFQTPEYLSAFESLPRTFSTRSENNQLGRNNSLDRKNTKTRLSNLRSPVGSIHFEPVKAELPVPDPVREIRASVAKTVQTEIETTRISLHPGGPFRNIWTNLMSIFYFYVLSVMTAKICFMDGISATENYVLTGVYFLDALINLVTLRIDDEGFEFDEWTSLELNLVSTTFLFDVVSTVPWSIVLNQFHADFGIPLINFDLIRLLKLTRLSASLNTALYKRIAHTTRDILGVGVNFMAFFTISFAMLVFLHFRGCFIFLFARNAHFSDRPWLPIHPTSMSFTQKYVQGVWMSMANTFPVTFKAWRPDTALAQWSEVVLCMAGAILSAAITGMISALSVGGQGPAGKFIVALDGLGEYLRAHELDNNRIGQRVRNSFQLKYQGKVFDEDNILCELNPWLRQEILLFGVEHILMKVPFFQRDLDDGRNELFLRSLADVLERKSFLRRECVMKEGERGDEMYFLIEGTMQIEVKDEVVGYLSAGTFFGEMSMFADMERGATVTAVSDCQCRVLHRDNLVKVVAEFPDVAQKLVTFFNERMQELSDQEGQEEKEFVDFDALMDMDNTSLWDAERLLEFGGWEEPPRQSLVDFDKLFGIGDVFLGEVREESEESS
ncbi:Potassium voltage-gated channel sub H member 7 [Podochytrium sp. JEL0797]|nr:Potassium voltage-gated channel sub H member 7 [Podochytrium sp. JEL0797]